MVHSVANEINVFRYAKACKHIIYFYIISHVHQFDNKNCIYVEPIEILFIETKMSTIELFIPVNMDSTESHLTAMSFNPRASVN